MPKYSYKCENCDNQEDKNISLQEYFKLKNKKIKCKKCENGVLIQEINNIRNLFERNKEQIIMDNKDEIHKTVEKIRAGDRKTIDDIYGDKPNPYKNNGVF